jgi:hypothetical protein
MPTQDTSQIKRRILSIIESKGPNFPSPIASEIQTSILFTSAFLSELLSEKKIKITNMKVGSSPIYYLPNQEEKLEPLAIKYLKSKEKDAFIILKEKKILKDSKQDPAIRVALRSIKDFAVPEEKNEELYWRYFLSESEEIPEEKIEPKKGPKEEDTKKENVQKNEEKNTEGLNIFDRENKEEEEETKKEKPTEQKKAVKKKTTKKKDSKKQDEKFFNKIKEYLASESIEITDIIGITKNDLTLKVSKEGKEFLIIAYNKKRITEKEIIEANKKSLEQEMGYTILSLGEPLKKLTNLIDAIKNIKDIKKIEN